MDIKRIRVSDFAFEHGVHSQTVRLYISRGIIAGTNDGYCWWMPIEEAERISKYIESHMGYKEICDTYGICRSLLNNEVGLGYLAMVPSKQRMFAKSYNRAEVERWNAERMERKESK